MIASECEPHRDQGTVFLGLSATTFTGARWGSRKSRPWIEIVFGTLTSGSQMPRPDSGQSEECLEKDAAHI